jgi:hypothetical protein
MTAQPQQPSLDVQGAMMKDLVVHQNVRQEIIVTTMDKLEICLMKHRSYLAARWEWIGPLGLCVSLVTTLVAAQFQQMGLSPETWKALYVIASILSGAWTILFIIRAIKASRSGGIEALIDKITNRQGLGGVYAEFYQAIADAVDRLATGRGPISTPWIDTNGAARLYASRRPSVGDAESRPNRRGAVGVPCRTDWTVVERLDGLELSTRQRPRTSGAVSKVRCPAIGRGASGAAGS